jgi:hypothetical protein
MNLNDSIWAAILFAGLTAGILARIYRQGGVRIFITDYQRGVRFVQGSFHDLLGPGSYASNPKREQVTIVDMRPQQILLERLQFQDAVLAASLISIGADLVVADPVLAVTTVKNPVADSMTIVRDALRAALSKMIADPHNAPRQKLAGDIELAINADLAKVGMRVANAEITELWSRSARASHGAGAS